MNKGKPPFVGPDQDSLYDAILKGVFSIPQKFSVDLADICKKLISVDVKKRLGCSNGKSDDIKKHKWFELVDWKSLFYQTVPSPYVPKVVNPLEIAFKDLNKIEKPLKISKTNKFKNEFNDF